MSCTWHTWWCSKQGTTRRVSRESLVTWPNRETLEDVIWLEQTQGLSGALKTTLFVKLCDISYHWFIDGKQFNHHTSAIIITMQDFFITLKRCAITNSIQSLPPVFSLRNKQILICLLSTNFPILEISKIWGSYNPYFVLHYWSMLHLLLMFKLYLLASCISCLFNLNTD